MNLLSRTTHPEYRRFPEKFIQFGEGNFLRAFVDWMIDVMNREAGFGAGVLVVQPLREGRVADLNAQDGLYTHFRQGITGGKAERTHGIINAVSRGIDPYSDYEAYLAAAEIPSLLFVVSNTTEAGIATDNEDRIDDRPPRSFPAKLTAFLHRRFRHFEGDRTKGMIFLPCELIESNGSRLREAILSLADRWGLENGFKSWISESNTFCNTLVDRIVTGYPKDRAPGVLEELGYEDRLIVESELFHLWVIEGPAWIAAELPAAEAGLNVRFVNDATPYRTRKVRILNGAHTCMVPVAYLAGIETVGEAIDHPLVGRFVKQTICSEILPTIEMPAAELDRFANDVIERFQNPFIRHRLLDIALNSISKFRVRVLPTLLDSHHRQFKPPRNLTFALAALIEFYGGRRGGERISLRDEPGVIGFFGAEWKRVDRSEASLAQLVTGVLGNQAFWGCDLNAIDGLHSAVTGHLAAIRRHGMVKALTELLT